MGYIYVCPQTWYNSQQGRRVGVWSTQGHTYSPQNALESLQPDHLNHNSYSPQSSGEWMGGYKVQVAYFIHFHFHLGHTNCSPSNRHATYISNGTSEYHSPTHPSASYPMTACAMSHTHHATPPRGVMQGDLGGGDDNVTSTTNWNITGNITGQCANATYRGNNSHRSCWL